MHQSMCRETGKKFTRNKALARDFLGLSDKAEVCLSAFRRAAAESVDCATLAMKPKMLFFDEPTSAVNTELTGEILKVIKDLAERDMTMVIVTHEMDLHGR